MFFYLLSNSTLIKEEDENAKNIKTLVYGAIAYIVLHATLFIGGDDCLFNGLKPYFWMLLLLDLAALYLVYLQKNKGSIDTSSISNVFRSKEREDVKPYLLDVSESIKSKPLQVNMPLPLKKKKKKRKNVSFQPEQQVNLSPGGSNMFDSGYSANLNGGFNAQENQPNMLNLNIIPQSESDSDSDITTDVDLNEFERSISM